MKKVAFLFPGQGSQSIGMGQSFTNVFPETDWFFKTANSVLNKDLQTLCFGGPNDELTLTTNAQPGIFVVSAIIDNLLKKEGITPHFVAGHSLGELSAYYSAGVFSYETALRIIKHRGESMLSAAPANTSGMAAIMKMDVEKIRSILEPFHASPVVVANLNCPGQIVISGELKALQQACDALQKEGARVIPLNVSGAFHSPLMNPASKALATFVKPLDFSSATCPIFLNRTATPESEASALKNNLSEQVISPVRWIETITALSQKVDYCIEVGPGKVISGLCKKINSDLICKSVSDPESLQEIIQEIKEGVRS